MRQLLVATLLCLPLVFPEKVGASDIPVKGTLVPGRAWSPVQEFQDTSYRQERKDAPPASPHTTLWGIDILISNDGFGLGTFYRRKLSDDLSGFLTLSISGSKDDREVERFDPFTQQSFTPGKLNRFIVVPLSVGVQYRLFREDIMDTFRPYLNVGAGPTMIYAAPFVSFRTTPQGTLAVEEVEFFSSLSRGQPHFTASSFIGAGAFFGSDQSSVFGVNFRYYFTYLFGDGIPSLYNTTNGQVTSTKKSFGGFVITLNIGVGS